MRKRYYTRFDPTLAHLLSKQSPQTWDYFYYEYVWFKVGLGAV
jgi:hypothetical protein